MLTNLILDKLIIQMQQLQNDEINFFDADILWSENLMF